MLYEVNFWVHCGGENLEVKAIKDKHKRQVFDIPPIEVEVTEHEVQTDYCHTYARETKPCFLQEVAQPTQYGKNTHSYIAYLNLYQSIPTNRL